VANGSFMPYHFEIESAVMKCTITDKYILYGYLPNMHNKSVNMVKVKVFD